MKLFQSTLILITSLIFTACASKAIDLMAEGDVEVLSVVSEHVEFSKIDVHQHGNKTKIEVVIRPQERLRQFTVGSLNLTVKQPDGSEQNIITDNAEIDKHRVGSKLQHAHFMVSIPTVLPSGSVVTISYTPSNAP